MRSSAILPWCLAALTALLAGMPAPAVAGGAGVALSTMYDTSVYGLQQRTLSPNCFVSRGESCEVSATLPADVAARLRLPGRTVGEEVEIGSGRATFDGERTVPVPITFPSEVIQGLASLRRPTTLSVTATGHTVTGQSGRVTKTLRLTPFITKADCVAAGYRSGQAVHCKAPGGTQTPGGGTSASHKGWPLITGFQLQVIDNNDRGRRLTGTYLNDELLGRNGSDTLTGGPGDDVLWGDSNPQYNGPRQRDRLDGGPGDDWLFASHGTNTMLAGPGNDHVTAWFGRGVIDCGPGRDVLDLNDSRRRLWKIRGCERIR